MDDRPPYPVKGRVRWVLERLWKVEGIWCMVVMGPVGYRLAYIRLPDGHPWIEVHTADGGWQLTGMPGAHGGINFHGEYPADQLENGDGVPDGYWLGWDYGHAFDNPEPGYWESATGHPYPVDGHHWTLAEVAADCTVAAATAAQAAT